MPTRRANRHRFIELLHPVELRIEHLRILRCEARCKLLVLAAFHLVEPRIVKREFFVVDEFAIRPQDEERSRFADLHTLQNLCHTIDGSIHADDSDKLAILIIDRLAQRHNPRFVRVALIDLGKLHIFRVYCILVPRARARIETFRHLILHHGRAVGEADVEVKDAGACRDVVDRLLQIVSLRQAGAPILGDGLHHGSLFLHTAVKLRRIAARALLHADLYRAFQP